MPLSPDEEEAEQQYVTSVCTELESAISDAVDSAISRQVEDPVKWVAEFMLRQRTAQQLDLPTPEPPAMSRIEELTAENERLAAEVDRLKTTGAGEQSSQLSIAMKRIEQLTAEKLIVLPAP